MDFFKFIFSITFLKNLVAAVILVLLIVFGLKIYLGTYTHHNEYHLVPDLTGKSFEEAQKILKDRKMNIVIIDTVDYNPKYPKYAVIEQNPHKNDKVKVGRKIYVKLNNDSYAKVSLPQIIGKTKRQAVSLIKASGLKVGKISTKPYFAEVVLYAVYQKDTLKNGSKIPKTSQIDLIIGDGKRPVEDTGNNTDGDTGDKTDNSIQNVLDNVLGN